MNNQIIRLQNEGISELNAIKAIQTLYQSIEKYYPVICNVSKSRMIKDHLCQITGEKNRENTIC